MPPSKRQQLEEAKATLLALTEYAGALEQTLAALPPSMRVTGAVRAFRLSEKTAKTSRALRLGATELAAVLAYVAERDDAPRSMVAIARRLVRESQRRGSAESWVWILESHLQGFVSAWRIGATAFDAAMVADGIDSALLYVCKTAVCSGCPLEFAEPGDRLETAARAVLRLLNEKRPGKRVTAWALTRAVAAAFGRRLPAKRAHALRSRAK